MSTYGVRTRFVDVLVRGKGRVTEAAFAGLVAHARERGITSGERKALLEPADYLRTSRVLKAHGIGLDDVRLDEAAWAAAETLARELGVSALFPELPNAQPGNRPAPTATTPAPQPGGGTSLGPMSSWKLETSGAVVTFETKAGGRSYPAVVLTNPDWKDPGPTRDVAAEHKAELAAVTSLAELSALVRRVVAQEHAYFEASDVEGGSRNRRYGIQDARRLAFFDALARAAQGLQLPAGERGRIAAVLADEKERLLCNRDYEMETGSHKNYWPYWDNYQGAVGKILQQTAPETDAYRAIKNRLEDIFDHKSVFDFKREIDEKDLERALGAALVHRVPFTAGVGHRVSLARDSYPSLPRYEVLTVAARSSQPSSASVRSRPARWRAEASPATGTAAAAST